MARSVLTIVLAMCALLVARASFDSCSIQVINWQTMDGNATTYNLGERIPNELVDCPSGLNSSPKPDYTSNVEANVLSQTLYQYIVPQLGNATDPNNNNSIYICSEGMRWLHWDAVSSCIGSNARNPREALVNGVAEFVCAHEARRRAISIQARVTYNKNCTTIG